MIPEILILLAGTLYGFIIGLIPSAGATTGLVALFSFIHYFSNDPYLGVVFCMAVVAASTTGDTYTSVLLGIPGANSAAATMVDGFPLALQGKATYAITAAVVTSTVNGLLWGTLTFSFLPYYTNLIMVFGIPELWAFTILALACVGLISSKYWIRSLLAVCLGLAIGYIGTDPATNSDRWTFGWFYLASGIQIMPMVAGLFAFPEIVDGFKNRNKLVAVQKYNHGQQTIDGIKVVWQNKWDALRGGFIGAFIGLLPGLGGAMSDWMAYGSTVAAYPNEKFGNGNIKGVIGPEGSNNAQKATSMIPTVLFGIPGASFAAVLMALFMSLNFELGTPDLVYDIKFFDSLTFGFMWSTIIVGIFCLLFTQYIAKIAYVPYIYYFPILTLFIIWACVQYTGGWEDYIILLICTVLGILAKKFKFSRPSILIGFILIERVENLTIQLTTVYTIPKLLDKPIFILLILCIVSLFCWMCFRKSSLDYA